MCPTRGEHIYPFAFSPLAGSLRGSTRYEAANTPARPAQAVDLASNKNPDNARSDADLPLASSPAAKLPSLSDPVEVNATKEPVSTFSLHVSDVSFRLAQAAMPAGAMIFQLPYASFPEGGSVQRMDDYSHFRGYLHTHGLRWTFGALKDSSADRFQQRVSSLPLVLQVKAELEGLVPDAMAHPAQHRAARHASLLS